MYKDSEYVITKPAQIRSLLNTLMSQHQLISVNPDDLKLWSISIVTDVPDKGLSFQLDGVREKRVHQQLVKGGYFSLLTSIDGVDVRANKLQVIELVGDPDDLYYQVNLPTQMLYLQRRGAFRAPVNELMKIESTAIFPTTLDEEDSEPEEARPCELLNISTTGCAIYAPGKEDDDTIKLCDQPVIIHLHLAESDETLKLYGIRRHQRYLKRRKCWRLGLQFINTPATTSHRIEKLIAELQFMIRKRN